MPPYAFGLLSQNTCSCKLLPFNAKYCPGMLTFDRHFIPSIQDVHCSLRSDGKTSSQVKLCFQSSCIRIFALTVNGSTIPNGSNILAATLNMVRLVSFFSFVTSSIRFLMFRDKVSFCVPHEAQYFYYLALRCCFL